MVLLFCLLIIGLRTGTKLEVVNGHFKRNLALIDIGRALIPVTGKTIELPRRTYACNGRWNEVRNWHPSFGIIHEIRGGQIVK
ncbi:uncharacterized protein BDZ99DRAFT_179267 [Mytilinidion resinicola]|uniref:Uncharacterized protein n=1 Tax=Mytilinidion resinicola TaxID=574789 RepID=A0A6A6Y5G5_9PEZI|nr:uncharacterized protein BDZ99DRAFT_179267 [Mytilinidion resinicola]KAF2803027.1 hypothetical protein BDZ99DRAFT_179267 [Mytilinidion resinicola]